MRTARADRVARSDYGSAMAPLSAETLASAADRVPTPTYDRAKVTAGVVHFGVGGFHRAHQAM